MAEHETSIEIIKEGVSGHFKLAANDLVASATQSEIVKARGLALFFAIKAGFSPNEIAAAFGYKSGQNVSSRVRRLENEFIDRGALYNEAMKLASEIGLDHLLE